MSTTGGVGLVKPVNLADQDVDSGLLRTAWSSDIQFMSLQHDPFFSTETLTETISVGENGKATMGTVPTACIVDVTPGDKSDKGARKVTVSYLDALNDNANTGNATSNLGLQETLQLRYFDAYCNDWAHSVAADAYGIDFREVSPYQIYEKIRPLLAQWRGEFNGYQARDGLINRISAEAASAPTLRTQSRNPHYYVPGASSQPTFSATSGTWDTAIGTTLAGTTYTDMHLTVPRALSLVDWLMDSYIQPIEWEGYTLYCLLACPEEFRSMHDPSVTASFGNYWVTAAALGSGELRKVIPGAEMVIGDSLVILRDRRSPTLTLSGNASAYTHSYGYMKMGRTSTRATGTTANTHFNVNLLLGRAALMKLEMEAPHFEEQWDEFKKYYAILLAGATTWQVPAFDLDTASASPKAEGSAIVVTQKSVA
jgi:hypothetical protein